MFRKLRLHLTLVNLIIIAALFTILISGTYLFTSLQTGRLSAHLLERVTADIIAGVHHEPSSPNLRPPRPPVFLSPLPGPVPSPPVNMSRSPQIPPHIFFVKVSPAGAISYSSVSVPLEAAQMAGLANKTLRLAQDTGYIDFGQHAYYYRRTALSSGDTLLVFDDATPHKSMLHTLLSALGIVGVICLILSYFGSSYMADRAIVPVSQAWRQQKDFLADASHELRTPLAVIQTNLEIVRGNTDESVAAQHNWLNNIQEEVGYMTKLVDSLLFLARVDARQIPCEHARFPLETAVRHTVMPFEPLAETKNIALTMQTEPLTYYGDEAKIKQLLGILLDNALRYTPAGGNVTVHLYKSPQAVHIDVADTGPGIAAEYLEKIFDRFFQVDPSRSKELGGTGLGLAIAKCLAACQRARIKVKSRPGEGSVFSVRLPLESTSGQPSVS